MTNSPSRPANLTPYEQNQLRKYGPAVTQIDWNQHQNTPIEHLTGKVEFMDHVLAVSPDVMIPRIETEQLVALGLKQLDLYTPQSSLSIADVGTGSGAVGLSLGSAAAAQYPQVNFNLRLSDVSAAALQIAQTNITNVFPTSIPSNLEIISFESDLLAAYDPNKKINLLLANLPYIPQARIAHLDRSVKDHEPHLALDGGPSGLELIHQLLSTAPSYLAPDSTVILEVDYTHQITDILATTNIFSGKIVRDQFDRQRFAVLTFQS